MARAARVRAPELQGRGGWLNTGGRELRIADFRGSFLIARLLDLLLRELPARPGRAAAVGRAVRRRADGRRRALAEVRARARPRGSRRSGGALPGRAPGARRPGPRDLAAVRRPRLADPGADRPRGLRRACRVRRGPRRRHRPTARGARRRARGQGNAPPGGRARTCHRCRGPATWPSPARRCRLPDGRLLVTDSAHHSLVVLDGEQVVRRIGSGDRGRQDGPDPSFAEPQGLCLLDDGRVLVADTANHLLRTVDLDERSRRPRWPARARSGARRPDERAGTGGAAVDPLGRGALAGRGRHRDGRHPPALGLGRRPGAGHRRDRRGGVARRRCDVRPTWPSQVAWRPAATGSGSPTPRPRRSAGTPTAMSAPRWAVACSTSGTGTARQARPPCSTRSASTVLADGSVAICDTYNGAVRRYDPVTERVSTLLTGLAEPSDAVVDGEHLLVVESAAHQGHPRSAPGGCPGRAGGPAADAATGHGCRSWRRAAGGGVRAATRAEAGLLVRTGHPVDRQRQSARAAADGRWSR